MAEGKAASTGKRILDKKSESKTWKLDPPGPLAQPPKCPECTSQRVWKDGLRYTRQGEVQRWLCRDCGHRFSETKVKLNIVDQTRAFHPRSHLAKPPIRKRDFSLEKALNDSAFPFSKDVGSHNVTVVGKRLNDLCSYNSKRQVCVSEREAKNLSQQPKTRQKQVAGATKPSEADIKGKIVDFLWWMQKQGYKESTIVSRGSRLRRFVKLGANLLSPESIKEIIAKQSNWSESRKVAMVYTYDLWAKWLGIEWTKPIYKAPRKLPFIPLEREIDDLIAGCNKYIATFLQLGKETGARAGEIFDLTWIDLDLENRTVNITPEKGSEPRIFKLSNKLIAMLSGFSKKEQQIFSHYKRLNNLRRTFERHRKKTAHKLGNPRLLRITFHTLRHWKATMEYHKTKDILYVMKLLGHRSIENTLVYTQLVNSIGEDEEYTSKAAKTINEARMLVEAGFEYVCEIEDVKLFRKRK